MSKSLLFAEICNDITKSIHNGTLLPGEPIPTIVELQEQYHVSHVTVLRAYQELVQRGVVAKSGRRYQVSIPAEHPDGTRTVFSCFRSLTSISPDDNYGNRIIVGLMRTCAFNGLFFYVPPMTVHFKGGTPVSDTVVSQLISEARQFGTKLPMLLLDNMITDEQIRELILPFVPGSQIVVVGRRSALPVFSVGHDFALLAENACKLLYRPGDRDYYWSVPSFLDRNGMGNEIVEHFESVLLRKGVKPSHLSRLPESDETDVQNKELCRRAVAMVEKHRGKVSFLVVSPFWARSLCTALTNAGFVASEDFRLLVSKGCEICVNEAPKISMLTFDGEVMGRQAIELLASRERQQPKFYVVQPQIELQGTI